MNFFKTLGSAFQRMVALCVCARLYEGRSISTRKLQNGVILLVFKIFLKIRNIRFVGNLILSTTFEFCYGDFTVTLFTNIQLATLLLKASRNEQRSVLHV